MFLWDAVSLNSGLHVFTCSSPSPCLPVKVKTRIGLITGVADETLTLSIDILVRLSVSWASHLLSYISHHWKLGPDSGTLAVSPIPTLWVGHLKVVTVISAHKPCPLLAGWAPPKKNGATGPKCPQRKTGQCRSRLLTVSQALAPKMNGTHPLSYYLPVLLYFISLLVFLLIFWSYLITLNFYI